MQGNGGRGVGALWTALKHRPVPRRASGRPGRPGSRAQRAHRDRAHRKIFSPWWTLYARGNTGLGTLTGRLPRPLGIHGRLVRPDHHDPAARRSPVGTGTARW